MSADLIVENARVLTMDPSRPRAAAIALQGNRIAAVGERAEVTGWRGSRTRVIDARGATVLPGFVESHMHVFPGGASLGRLVLDGVLGFERVAGLVRAWAAEHPQDRVIYALQGSYQMLGEPITRHALDRILGDRPFAIHAYDGHTVWANTKALELAGLLHGRELLPGNEIVMGEDGLATGELREPQAYTPLLKFLPSGGRESLGVATGRDPDPPPTAAERAADRDAIAAGLEHCARHGITSIHNMDGNPYQLGLLEELDDEGRLLCRIRLPHHQKNDMTLAELRDGALAMRARSRPDRVVCDFVKVFVDGVIDSTTALMLDDYGGRPGHRGQALFSAEQLTEVVTEADRLGFQVAIHSIGDGGVRRTLDAFAAARAANGARDSRHRVEHIEVIDPADVPRFAELGAIASMQPLHAPGPLSYPGHELMALIGPARQPWAYAWRTLLEAGARMAFSSDWPVSPVNPLLSIQAAITRRPWREGQPEQAVSLMQALAAYTAGGAYAAFAEDRLGRVAPGFLADLVVLDGDIEATPPDRIKERRVAFTVGDGRITYARS